MYFICTRLFLHGAINDAIVVSLAILMVILGPGMHAVTRQDPLAETCLPVLAEGSEQSLHMLKVRGNIIKTSDQSYIFCIASYSQYSSR